MEKIMGLFDKLKNVVEKVEQTAKEFEQIKTQLENTNISLEDISSAVSIEPNENRLVLALPIEWKKNLTNEQIMFEFMGINFRYRRTNPTNFYISNNSFIVNEISNVYFYSENGQEFDYTDEDIYKTIIMIQMIPSNVNTIEEWTEYLDKWYKLKKVIPKIQKIDNEYPTYIVQGETNSKCYIGHVYFYNGVKIGFELMVDKNQLSIETIQNVLNEYYAIINTLTLEKIPEYE